MTKYVVFAGSNVFGDNVARSVGYLDRLIYQKVLEGPITSGNIRKLEDINFLFRWDGLIKSILQNFELKPSYTVVRAEVLDGKRLEESIPDFKIRYGYSHHAIYDL